MTRLTRRQLITARWASNSPGAIAGPPVHARSSWALDRPPKGDLHEEDVRFLLVHHTASANGHTAAEVPAILRGIFDFHTSAEKGWNDIAYNFLIDSEGGIWEGRHGSLSGAVAGDATGGNQGFSQLVCLIGDYNVAIPSDASLASLVATLAWLAERHDIDTRPSATTSFVSRGSNLWPEGTTVTTPTITGHRTMSKTSCPGDNLFSYVEDGLMAEVTSERSVMATTITTHARAPESSTVRAPVAIESLDPVPTTSTTTTMPGTPPPTGSPLLRLAAALALVVTGAAVWRARRMKGQ